MPIGDLAPEIAVVVAALTALLVAAFTTHERQWVCAPIALLGLAIAAFLCAYQIGETRTTFSGVWAIDGASIWGRMLIIGATAFALMLSPSWFASDRRHGEYYAILLMSAVAAMVLAAASNLLQLVMGLLLSSVTGYTLAAYHRDWPLSVEAGMKYFLVGALANALFMIGVTLVVGLLGSPGYEEMAARLSGVGSSPLLLLGVSLLVVGLAFKLAAVPAHSWMPDVAEGAPAPAAAFLTVVPKIGAAIALIRLVSLFPPESIAIRPLIALLAVATMTLGNLAAIWQNDVRRLIGWSSVSQSGYALVAVCVVGLTDSALPALFVFLVGYGAANLTAFAAVCHLRGRTALPDYAGIASKTAAAGAALATGFLSLVGIPPLAGFVGKLTLFVAAVDAGYAWLAVIAIANTVVSLFYYLRVIAALYFGKTEIAPEVLGRLTAVAAWLGIALTVGFGIASEATLSVIIQNPVFANDVSR